MVKVIIRTVFWLSWGSIFFIPKKAIKDYLPVTILASLFALITMVIGREYNFWEKGKNVKSTMWNHLSLVLGSFSVANMWIFHKTFGDFKKYLLTSLMNNIVFGFGLISILDKFKNIRYFKFTNYHHILLTMAESLLLYGFHKIYNSSRKEAPFTSE